MLNETCPILCSPVLLIPDGLSEVDYLSAVDVKKLGWGIAQARKILASPPFSLDIQNAEVSPGPKITSENELAGWIRQNVHTYSHWAGTVRMGNGYSSSSEKSGEYVKESAVDPSLRVRGTANLHVVDASVMPHITNGNIQATVTAIGYRAADLITNKN